MWYQKNTEELSSLLNTNISTGLSKEEVGRRLKRDGDNSLPEIKKESWYNFLLRQFKNPLVYILVLGAIITFILRDWVDMTVILLAVLVNVSVGFWQEFKSNNILKKLKEIVYVKALVTRDGQIKEINSKELVTGDLIHLRPGIKVPADSRIIESSNLYINQAALTGESLPDKKDNAVIKTETPVADTSNMAYMGTVVQSGHGKALVVKTAKDTEVGKIALLAEREKDAKTPLQLKMASLGRIIALVVGVFAIFIIILGTTGNLAFTFDELLITAIAVLVAGVPEGLPAAISIILAVSAQKILKKKGVIKNLIAAETLGGATVICTDKTGTLTEGKMRVIELYLEKGINIEDAYHSMALANEAVLESGSTPLGEPTDVAKLEYAIKNDVDHKKLYQKFPQKGFLEFRPENKFIASVHEHNDNFLLFTNGAPEEILGRSIGLAKSELDILNKKSDSYAKQGLRVIALGKKVFTTKEEITPELIEKEVKDLEFLGLAIIQDPLRSDVVESIRISAEAGVRTLMITGDHRLTAVNVAQELGFKEYDKALLGSDLDRMSDKELKEVVGNIQIFARTTPEHKVRIVKALRSRGEVVAMTGDGVNDSPALTRADIGIALNSGTDIAKEASDLVLLNDSFSTIISSIKQGRIAFDNIRKVSVLLLTSSFSEIILIMSALVIPIFSNSFEALPLPITALQILYVNLVEDTLPNIAMAFEPGEKDVMKRPPTKKDEPILDREAKLIVFFVGLVIDIILVLVFLWLVAKNVPVKTVQTVIFAAIGIDTLLYVFSIKSLRHSIWKGPIFNNKYLIYAVIIGFFSVAVGIYAPVMNNILGTVPLDSTLLTIIISLAFMKLALIELIKVIFGTVRTQPKSIPMGA